MEYDPVSLNPPDTDDPPQPIPAVPNGGGEIKPAPSVWDSFPEIAR